MTVFHEGDWRAAAHYLERKHPDRWGRRVPPHVEEATTTAKSPEDWEREVEELMAKMRE